MSLRLSNPKEFLPLLLFIGFVFSLIGIGFYSLGTNPELLVVGFFVMFVAVMLFAMMNRRRMGF